MGYAPLLPKLRLERAPVAPTHPDHPRADAGPTSPGHQRIEELVVRARRGDSQAQRQLYEDHVGAVMGYCLRFCRGDHQQALDLCQEVFVTAFSRLGELREADRFSGWLKVITRRSCLRWIERQQTEKGAVLRLAEEPPPSPKPATHDPRDHAAEIVREVIDACPDANLKEVARRFYTDPPESTQEIALALGISRTAVTTRLLRFRAWARTRMLARLAHALEEFQACT